MGFLEIWQQEGEGLRAGKDQRVDVRFPIARVGVLEPILEDINLRHSQLEGVLALKNHYKAVLGERYGLCLVLLLFWEETQSPLQLPLKGEDRDPLIGDVEADDFLRSREFLPLHQRGGLETQDLRNILSPEKLIAEALPLARG